MAEPEINSRAYWDGRFAADWDAADGPRQSRWFAELALARLPGWLLGAVRDQRLTVVDWGCAEGDGTDAWTAHVEPDRLTGVDFSEVAVARAASRYPSLRFVADAWLTGPAAAPTHDVVFSSNTLEHFERPDDVLAAIATRARKAIVLLLPYRESPRHPEHAAGFDAAGIRVVLDGGFELRGAVVGDCNGLPGAAWTGEQILLVYVEPGWARSLELRLADVEISQDDLAAARDRLAAQARALDAETREWQARAAALEAEGTRLRERITTLEQRHARRLSTRLYRSWRRLVDRR